MPTPTEQQIETLRKLRKAAIQATFQREERFIYALNAQGWNLINLQVDYHAKQGATKEQAEATAAFFELAANHALPIIDQMEADVRERDLWIAALEDRLLRLAKAANRALHHGSLPDAVNNELEAAIEGVICVNCGDGFANELCDYHGHVCHMCLDFPCCENEE